MSPRPRRPPREVEAHAFAKVNLGWRVGARRPDGYHDVSGLVQTVSLADRLVVRAGDGEGTPIPLDDDTHLFLSVGGDEGGPHLQTEDNLVVAAARVLAERTAPRTVAVRLEKSIPEAAGLGGGSADAAAALLALRFVWSAALPAAALVSLASEVGSDVPALLVGGLVHASGRGEVVRSVGSATGTHFVLGFTQERLPAAQVYEELDRLRGASRPAESGPWSNDLQAAAVSLLPVLAEGLRVMREAGATASFVSGSGPTVVGVAADAVHAESVRRAVGSAFNRVVLTCGVPYGVRLRFSSQSAGTSVPHSPSRQ